MWIFKAEGNPSSILPAEGESGFRMGGFDFPHPIPVLSIFRGRMSVRSGLVFLIASLLADTAPALAAGFLIRENSTAAVGMTYAGTGSLAEGAETVFANPAGMTELSRDELEAGATLIIPDTRFRGSATAFGGAVSGTDGGNAGPLAGFPSLYGSFGLTDDLKAGIAVTIPFGNATDYGTGWVGRYLATKTMALSYDINPNLAWKLSDDISIGAGFSAQYLKLDVTSAIAQSIIFGVPAPDAFNRFVAHDWGFGFNLGALVKVGEASRVGLTYRSGVDHDIEGSLNFTGASPLLGLMSGPAHARVKLPASMGASFTSDIDPELTVSADVQFTHWSVFRDIVVQSANPPVDYRQNYRDSWMFAAGARYRLGPQWTVRGGLAWDETPVMSRFRTVNLPDTDRFLLGMGSSYQLTDAVILSAAYAHSIAFARPTMDISANNTDPVTHAVVLHGHYDVNVDILSLSLRYQY